MYSFLILTVCLKTVFSELIFEDNFNELNETKWQIFGSNSNCSKLTDAQLSCAKNNEQNLMNISGTIALTAIYENYLDNNFTSATIVTRQPISFNFWNSQQEIPFKLIIRAALPTTNELQASVILIPDEDIYYRTTKAKIIVFQNNINQVQSGYFDNYGQIVPHSGSRSTNKDLSVFHIYEYTITGSDFMGTIDGTQYYFQQRDTKCECSAIFGENNLASYKLVISLQVTNELAGTLDKVIESAKSWNCSSFIIDWVKIYVNEPKDNVSIDHDNNDKLPKQICSSINQVIGRTTILNSTKTTILNSTTTEQTNQDKNTTVSMLSDHNDHVPHSLIWIFAILLSVFIIALIITVVMLFRIKRNLSNTEDPIPDIQIDLPDIVTNMRDVSIYETCVNRLTVFDENYEEIPYPEYDQFIVERVQNIYES